MSGLCAPELRGLDVRALPWERIKREDVPGFELIKRSHTRRVLRTTWINDGESASSLEIFAKRYKARTPLKGALYLLYSPKARREFDLLVKMKEAGVPGPRPLMWAIEKKGSRVAFSYLITESLGGDIRSLRQWLASKPGDDERGRLLRDAARFVREGHERGFYHDDCSAEHIAIDGSRWSGGNALEFPAGFYFLDVDNARLGAKPVSLDARLKNIVQVWRSLPNTARMTDDEIMAFLIECLGDRAPDAMHRIHARLNRIARRKAGKSIL